MSFEIDCFQRFKTDLLINFQSNKYVAFCEYTLIEYNFKNSMLFFSIYVTFLLIKMYNLIFTITLLIKLTFLAKIKIRSKLTFKLTSCRGFKMILFRRYNIELNVF